MENHLYSSPPEDKGHLEVEVYIDVDWAISVMDKRSTSGYCTFFGRNLVTWQSKKQNGLLEAVRKQSLEQLLKVFVKFFGSKDCLKNLLTYRVVTS